MSETNTIITKIQALLAKAESTEYEEEADLFTAKAHELMLRHAIDEAELQLKGKHKGEIGRDVFIYSTNDANLPGKRGILNVAAKAAGCKAVFITGSRKKQTSFLVGYETDREWAAMLYTSLLMQATSAGRREYKRDNPPFGLKRYLTGFMSGFAARIGQRLDEMTKQVDDNSKGSLLPVLASKEMHVEEAMREFFPQTKAIQRHRPDLGSYTAGDRAGRTADIGQRSAGSGGARKALS